MVEGFAWQVEQIKNEIKRATRLRLSDDEVKRYARDFRSLSENLREVLHHIPDIRKDRARSRRALAAKAEARVNPDAYQSFWTQLGYKIGSAEFKRRIADIQRRNPSAVGAQTPMIQMLQLWNLRHLYYDLAGVDDWISEVDPALEYGENVKLAFEKYGVALPSDIKVLQHKQEEQFAADQEESLHSELEEIIKDVSYPALVEICALREDEVSGYAVSHPFVAVASIWEKCHEMVRSFGEDKIRAILAKMSPVRPVEVIRPAAAVPKRPEVPAKPEKIPEELPVEIVTLPDEILRYIQRSPGRDSRYYEMLLRDIEDRRYDGMSGEQISLAIDAIRPIIEELRRAEIEKEKARKAPSKPVEVELPVRRERERLPTVELPPAVEVEVKPIKMVDQVALGRELEALAVERFGTEFRFLNAEQKTEIYPVALERVSKAGKVVSRLPEIEVRLMQMRDKYGRLVFPQDKLYWTLSREDWEKVYPWTESLPMKVYRAFSEGALDYGDFEEIGISRWQVDEWLIYAKAEMKRRLTVSL